jgi:hypothetical protein
MYPGAGGAGIYQQPQMYGGGGAPTRRTIRRK